MVEIDVGQFLSWFDIVSLIWGDVSEHGDGHFYVSAGDGQVRISNGDSHLLSCPTELIDGILHHLSCLMLQTIHNSDD